MIDHVFVYGTLLPGDVRWRYLEPFVTDEGRSIRLTGARDIAQFALNSEPAQNAFIEQFFHQVVKQPMLAYGSDTMSRLRQSFVASEFNLQKLLVDIAVTSATHGLDTPVRTAKK